MNIWKKLALTSLVAVSATGLVACGSNTKSNNSSGPVKGQTLTIGYWKGSDTENHTFDKLVKKFEKKYDVKVKPKVYTNLTQQLPTDFAGGTAPDVFYIDSSFYPYLQQEGVLNNLSDVINKKDFYASSINAFQTDGKIYGVPKDVSTLAIYVNKEIFSKAGIDINTIPTSYEDFLKWAPAQQEKLDQVYGKGKVYMMNMNADMARNWQFLSASNQNPIQDNKSKLSSSKIVNNVAFIQKMFNAGIIATPDQVGAGGDEGAAFGTGKFAMVMTGNWNYQVFKTQYSKLDFTIIPNLTYEGKKQTMQYTVGWGENKATKVKKLSDNWIKYATGKEGMLMWTSGVGTLATRDDVNNNSAFIKANPLLKVHSSALPYATPWQDGVNLTTVVTSYNNFITSAFKKNSTLSDLQTALKKADKDANSKLNK